MHSIYFLLRIHCLIKRYVRLFKNDVIPDLYDLSFFETQKLFQCMEKDSIFCKNFSVPQRKKPVWIYLYKNENASNISTVDCIQLYFSYRLHWIRLYQCYTSLAENNSLVPFFFRIPQAISGWMGIDRELQSLNRFSDAQ